MSKHVLKIIGGAIQKPLAIHDLNYICFKIVDGDLVLQTNYNILWNFNELPLEPGIFMKTFK